MGGGTYSSDRRSLSASLKGYHKKSIEQVLSQTNIHKLMDPLKLVLRESRDSVEHPRSFPLILALDVTASMGMIPSMLIKSGLPKMIQTIIDAGFPDPQVMFLGIGDHKCDSAPLQVGQFESNDLDMDEWLEKVWLERGGGGNGGESYPLAWLVGGNHTSHDAWEKRGTKGLIITIGDESLHQNYSKNSLARIIESTEIGYSAKELLDKARETYEVFHIGLTNRMSSYEVKSWTDFMPENFIGIDDYELIPEKIASLVVKLALSMGENKVGTSNDLKDMSKPLDDESLHANQSNDLDLDKGRKHR